MKIIQIISHDGKIVGLCNEGAVWEYTPCSYADGIVISGWSRLNFVTDSSDTPPHQTTPEESDK